MKLKNGLKDYLKVHEKNKKYYASEIIQNKQDAMTL